MKSVNKILSLVLCLTMVLSVFAIVPFAAGAAGADVAETGASSGTTGDCTWTLDDDGVLTISGNGAMGNDEPHPWGTNISKVIIEEGVTSIGYLTFFECAKLTSIDIPDSVTSIGWTAFADCTGLTNVTIGNSVTIIDDEAFSGCTGLTSVDIPDSVTRIGFFAFNGCTGLTSIDIPDSVTSIGYRAFGDTAWYNNQPDSLVYAGKVAYDMKGTCPSEVVIKEGTLGIADSAFYGCKSLTSIDIPDSVTSIGRYAFYACDGLTSVTIPDSVTSIGEGAFSECYGLESVTIGNSVTSIGEHAFSYCSSLSSVTIGYSVTTIGDYAFYACDGLTSVTIPDSVTSIGDHALPSSTHICCSPGSAAETYAKEWGYSYGHDYVLTPIDAENHQGVCSYCGDKTEPEAHTFTDGVCACGTKANGVVNGYFYIDGVLAKGKGAVKYENDIYYVRNDGSVFTSGKLYVTEAKANGLISKGTHKFDANGRLTDSKIVNGYYYVNGKKAPGAGIVEYKGDIYFINNNSAVYTSGQLYVTEAKANGLISKGTHKFDATGKLTDSKIVKGYYYVNGKKAPGSGIVEYKGDIYFIKNNSAVYTSGTLYVTEAKANGLVTKGTHRFDDTGKLIG